MNLSSNGGRDLQIQNAKGARSVEIEKEMIDEERSTVKS